MPESRIPVAVLGATGSVGQRFVQLLEHHPWFELVAVTGSERRLGKQYAETCHWTLAEAMPEDARKLKLLPTDPKEVEVPLAFSALPAGQALEMEPAFARAGVMVCSNAGAFRRESDVPILLPEVNPDHVELIPFQRRNRGWTGGIATNPNCTSTGTTIALKAFHDAVGLERVFAVSLQAVSGAGYPGVPSLDILGNVVPYISNEEPKLEWEPRKMIGMLQDGCVQLADFAISSHCNRVPVIDGHIVCLTLECRNEVSPQDARGILANFRVPSRSEGLPSTPQPVIDVRAEPDRPQPRLDRMNGGGMTTVVGRIREDTLLDLRLTVLSHNTIRGAAGGSIYNAELLLKEGLINR